MVLILSSPFPQTSSSSESADNMGADFLSACGFFTSVYQGRWGGCEVLAYGRGAEQRQCVLGALD